ncbi:MAG: ATP-binding protein [Bacteroidota bacterium]
MRLADRRRGARRYVPLSANGGQLLFQFLNLRHECRSTIVTTNLEFGNWTKVFGDEQLTAALLDRLAHLARWPGRTVSRTPPWRPAAATIERMKMATTRYSQGSRPCRLSSAPAKDENARRIFVVAIKEDFNPPLSARTQLKCNGTFFNKRYKSRALLPAG